MARSAPAETRPKQESEGEENRASKWHNWPRRKLDQTDAGFYGGNSPESLPLSILRSYAQSGTPAIEFFLLPAGEGIASFFFAGFLKGDFRVHAALGWEAKRQI